MVELVLFISASLSSWFIVGIITQVGTAATFCRAGDWCEWSQQDSASQRLK